MRKVREFEVSRLRTLMGPTAGTRISREQLSDALRSLGHLPEEDEANDAIEEAGVSRLQDLSLDEVWWVLEAYRRRESLSFSEAEEVQRVFECCERDGSGRLSAIEVGSTLRLMGHPVSSCLAQQLVSQVGANASGSVDLFEFLKIFRMYRDRCDRRALGDYNRSWGLLSSEDTFSAGATRSRIVQVLQELVNSVLAGPPKHGSKLKTKLLRRLSKASQDLVADGGSILSQDELFRLTSSLQPRTVGPREDVIVEGEQSPEVYIIERGLCELVKLVNGREVVVGQLGRGDIFGEVTAFYGVPRMATVRTAASGDVTLLSLRHTDLFKAVDGDLTLRTPAIGSTPGPQSCNHFVAADRRLRRRMRLRRAECSGFHEQELEDLKRRFAKYDVHKIGSIPICKVLTHLFPDIAHSVSRRPDLVKLLHDASVDSSKDVDFASFLRLARKEADLSERNVLYKEGAVIAETAFTRWEVKEIRKLFLADEDRERISLLEVREMLANITPMGHENSKRLREFFEKVVSVVSGRQEETATFPEFLQLLGLLLDSDFGGMRQLKQQMASIGQHPSEPSLVDTSGVQLTAPS